MAVVDYLVVNGILLSETRGGVESDYIADPLGSTAALMSTAGVITDTFTYWPYGQVRSHVGSSVTPYQYCGTLGYYSDGASGRVYVDARVYIPSSTRWLTVDPLWPTEQPYLYAGGNPPTFSDASGLKPAPNPRSACYYLVCSGKLAWDRFNEVRKIPKDLPKTCGDLAKFITKTYSKRDKKDPIEECIEKAEKNQGIVGRSVNWVCNHIGITTSGRSCACAYGEDTAGCNKCCAGMKGWTQGCYADCLSAAGDYQGFWDLHCVARK